MHPILSQLRRVIIYLLAWIPIAGLLAYLLTVSHEISAHAAIVLSVPLCLLYAFLCLTSWYSCRGNPLEKYGLGRLIATHLTAALVASRLALCALTLRVLSTGLDLLGVPAPERM